MEGYKLTQIVLLITTVFLSCVARAEDKTSTGEYDIIIATPNQCVALNRGQVCYQDVTLVWRSRKVGDFCVGSSQTQTPLQCWQNQQEGEMALEVKATESVRFTLNTQEDNTQLAEALMRVAWVYQQKRRKLASWRLF